MKTFRVLIFCFFWGMLLSGYSQTLQKEVNYIPYYLQVYEADSLYMIGDYESSFGILNKLKNTYEFIKTPSVDEHELYIILKQQLSHVKNDEFLDLVSNYGLNQQYIDQTSSLKNIQDSLNIQPSVINKLYADYVSKINRKLRIQIDSLNRIDQEIRHNYKTVSDVRKVDSSNYVFVKKILEKFGFPTHKLVGKYNEFDDHIGGGNLGILLNHFSYNGDYNYLKIKILDEVKKGNAPPIEYAVMVERYTEIFEKYSPYGLWGSIKEIPKDSIPKINKRRKEIGLYSIEYQILKNEYYSNN